MKFVSFVLTILFLFIFFVNKIYALSSDISCSDRYLTLVNPVRSREMWGNKTTKPLRDQLDVINDNKFKATWLLQYSVLLDDEVLNILKNDNKYHEIGVFLEIDKNLAKDAKVIYPNFVAWASPSAIFLSAYSRSERIDLIDKVFKVYKEKFGKYPSSVGAWWIDSYSLSYMKRKYNIQSAMIVADQKTTDHYGVWGQWWGFAYKPSKTNILIPAKNLDQLEDVLVIQWAQRDPDKAYGDGPKYSNYSLQANDYIRQGLDTKYFLNLVTSYLDCANRLAQVTVGLETGMESIEFSEEYKRQLLSLKSIKSLKSVTMTEFANKFSQFYSINPHKVILKGSKGVWEMNVDYRSNIELGDIIIYENNSPFFDYFIRDRSNFLDRRLTSLGSVKKNSINNGHVILILTFILLLYFIKNKKLSNFFAALLFLISCFGLLLKSTVINGWIVYFGPEVKYLLETQLLITIMVYLFFSKIKNKFFMYMIPLSFALDYILQALRYTFISGSHYLGVAINPLRILGISISDKLRLKFIDIEFSSEIANAFVKFDFQKIWSNQIYTFLIYPIVHILIALILYKILKSITNNKRYIIIIILIFLFVLYVLRMLYSDPLVVLNLK